MRMGNLLAALLHLQSVERQRVQVTRRIERKVSSSANQKKRIDQMNEDLQGLHQQTIQQRKEADGYELELKEREEHISHLRSSLNQAKTNKEYAAVLKEINTLKADSSQVEEQALNAIEEVENLKGEAEKLSEQIKTEQHRLEEMEKQNAGEIERLRKMEEELIAKRREAAAEIPPDTMTIFERVAQRYGGEAMAPVETHGDKPPYSYICGGCFMSLNAEHANALRVKDEIRTCDNCGRILYIPSAEEESSRE